MNSPPRQRNPDIFRNRMGIRSENKCDQLTNFVIWEQEVKHPPIFVRGVKNIERLRRLLDKVADGKYSLKIQTAQIVKIMPKSKTKCRAIINELELNGLEFYKFNPCRNKTFKVVLRNVHYSVDVNEIIEELKSNDHTVVRMSYVLNSRNMSPFPLYFVELEPRENNTEIFKIKVLLNMRVKFAPPESIGKMASKHTECHRRGGERRFNYADNRSHVQHEQNLPTNGAGYRVYTREKKIRSEVAPKLREKTPSAPPPPYLDPATGHHAPYGFTNAGQPHPQGPYMQPPTGPPGYNYQPGYSPPQPGYVQPHPGYNAPQPGYGQPQPNYMPGHPGYGSPQPAPQTVPSVSHPGQTETVTVQPQGNTTVVVLGGCPTCRTGALEDNFTCLGVCCAIVFFPIGILCCLAMKEKRCTNCHATF